MSLPGELHFKPLALLTLYIIVIQLSMATGAFLLIYERMYNLLNEKSVFIEHLLDGAFMVAFSAAIGMPFGYWLEMNKMLKFINSWREFQVSFCSHWYAF